VSHALEIAPLGGAAIGAAAGYFGLPVLSYLAARPFRGPRATLEFLGPMAALPYIVANSG